MHPLNDANQRNIDSDIAGSVVDDHTRAEATQLMKTMESNMEESEMAQKARDEESKDGVPDPGCFDIDNYLALSNNEKRQQIITFRRRKFI